jgi:hypothetical protein
MHRRIVRGNRESLGASVMERSFGAVQRRSRREGRERTPTMNPARQSDRCIVPSKFPNKPAQAGAEGMEGRQRRKGNVV